jgi:hypothetical protein
MPPKTGKGHEESTAKRQPVGARNSFVIGGSRESRIGARPMQVRLWRGFNRLFVALTIVWAICCTVIFPLRMQFDGQRQAFSQHNKDTQMCQQLMVERPEWDMTKNCFERIDEYQRNTMESYSFRKFWVWDVAFWRLEIPAIVLPPLLVYALAMIGRWIWRGFVSPASKNISA